MCRRLNKNCERIDMFARTDASVREERRKTQSNINIQWNCVFHTTKKRSSFLKL